jgi:hypothetical protein
MSINLLLSINMGYLNGRYAFWTNLSRASFERIVNKVLAPFIMILHFAT